MRILREYREIPFPIVLILSLGIASLFLPDKTFSKREMRYLTQFPTFSVEKIVSGEYFQKIDAYLADQFVFRDFWLSIEMEKETEG